MILDIGSNPVFYNNDLNASPETEYSKSNHENKSYIKYLFLDSRYIVCRFCFQMKINNNKKILISKYMYDIDFLCSRDFFYYIN